MGSGRSKKSQGFLNTCNTNLKLSDSFVCTQWWFNLTMHLRRRICLCSVSCQDNKEGQCWVRLFCLLSWRIYGDSGGDKRWVLHCISLRHHYNQLWYLRSAVRAAPLSYYRQQVQMVKGRCSAKKKGKEEDGGKKEQAPGPSVIPVWGCFHYD